MLKDKEPAILSQLLSITDHISHYDASSKRLLSHKSILAFILKACIPAYKEVSIKDIAQKYIEGTPQISSVPVFPDQEGALIKGDTTEDKTLYEGTRHYDIRFSAYLPASQVPIPILVNLENQISFSPGYPVIMRALYYGARMISSQYGKEFTYSHYEKIKPVYSIWIFPQPPKAFENSLTEFLIDQRHVEGQKIPDLPQRDLMRIIFIGLGDPEHGEQGSIWRMLGTLLSTKMNVDTKRTILEGEYGLEMTHEIEKEVREMSSLGQGVFEQGLAQGRIEGRAEGHAEGQMEEQAKMVSKIMEKMNFNLTQALHFLDIPEDQYEIHRELLKNKS